MGQQRQRGEDKQLRELGYVSLCLLVSIPSSGGVVVHLPALKAVLMYMLVTRPTEKLVENDLNLKCAQFEEVRS
jgi:hypothetical protein